MDRFVSSHELEKNRRSAEKTPDAEPSQRGPADCLWKQLNDRKRMEEERDMAKDWPAPDQLEQNELIYYDFYRSKMRHEEMILNRQLDEFKKASVLAASKKKSDVDLIEQIALSKKKAVQSERCKNSSNSSKRPLNSLLGIRVIPIVKATASSSTPPPQKSDSENDGTDSKKKKTEP